MTGPMSSWKRGIKRGLSPLGIWGRGMGKGGKRRMEGGGWGEGDDKGEEFCKSPHPHPYITLYTFHACNENDLTVLRGQLLTVLNKDDPDWFWVCRSHDNQEGFVPSAFVFPFNYLKEEQSKKEVTKLCEVNNRREVDRNLGTELVLLYDYKAQAPDDLSVKRGDWVYADLEGQTVEGWLWAWSPKSRKYGFLPRAYARVPVMTSL
ncbi:Intersectin-2 [Folsomia candida]|uniref:Intersectin-2 n=1 Tax=Folsomia candida TaxID=158441 RepID=A0A226EIN4_FOLCA|nr:Intersectin-2 [Folsomia candida]